MPRSLLDSGRSLAYFKRKGTDPKGTPPAAPNCESFVFSVPQPLAHVAIIFLIPVDSRPICTIFSYYLQIKSAFSTSNAERFYLNLLPYSRDSEEESGSNLFHCGSEGSLQGVWLCEVSRAAKIHHRVDVDDLSSDDRSIER